MLRPARRVSCALVLLATMGALLLGCPEPAGSDPRVRKAEGTSCANAGDRCEFAPGKLGLCTAKPEGCGGGSCLTCVSLH